MTTKNNIVFFLIYRLKKQILFEFEFSSVQLNDIYIFELN